ncbi:Membrane lipoprotein TmpC precursor [Candidatus Izimaplasma bacterium HR1]|jgi:basic membrane protein A|uniref:BMP family lipoprotein n=1 Tax=Candidatus Izimoplasma sp. HR1 TaxID=1541959 RepID=UPI0004F63FF3|nr:Membrane lipoprotein TmpC precursor [Candidatus Izimaplasma bacterium HR1]
MKKLLVFMAAFVVMISLTACQKETFTVALVTDVGTVTDKSFNQGAWEGVVQFAEEFEYSHQYYQPDDQTTDEYVKSIDLAVENGAEVVVTPGFFFENTIWLVQDKYPEVKFIILDGAPHNVADWDTGDTVDGEAWDFTQGANVTAIFYEEHESGFLAGYAAVADGLTELGFMGGKAVPAVVRFGYGFVQGAAKAAEEMDKMVTIKYNYLGGFGPDPAFQAKAATWYDEGTEVIFACAGGAGGSVMKAAEQEEGLVIGVDVDQSAESTTVITSAKKELAPSVYETLKDWHEGNWPGGQLRFSAENLGVALPENFDRFTTFDSTLYATLLTKVQDGTYVVDATLQVDGTDKTTAELLADYVAGTYTTVTIIE